MSDSGSSMGVGEARMLERRVSNNRADLNSDQQMNYFLSWFTAWSELQRADFVPVLAGKMSQGVKSASSNGGSSSSNGVVDSCLEAAFKSMDMDSSRPPTLFSCQVRNWSETLACSRNNISKVVLIDI